jgi:hypothetical protein
MKIIIEVYLDLSQIQDSARDLAELLAAVAGLSPIVENVGWKIDLPK